MGRAGTHDSSWLGRRRLDRILATLGVIVAVGMLPLRMVVSHIYATALPITLGLASILYLLGTFTDPALDYPFPTLETSGARIAELLVLLGITVLLVYGGVVGRRTIVFYDLAGLVGAALFLQILFVGRDGLRPSIILFEILALAITIRFVGLYSVAGYIGIDVWSHIAFVEGIRTQGTMRALNTKYVASPLYHLLVAVTADLTGLPTQDALYLSVGLVVALATGLVYYGTRQLTGSRWALFATALFGISAQVIRWGLHVIPTSLGLAFYLVVVTALIRVLQEYRLRDIVVLVGAIVAVTLTHQVSAFITLVTLGVAFLTQLLASSDRFAPEATPVNVAGLLAFTAGFITLDWSVTPYSGASFTRVMLLRLRDTLFRQIGLLDVSSAKNVSSTAGQASASLATKIIAYINVFGFMALLFLGVVGSYYVFQRRNRTHPTLFEVGGIGVMAMFVLALPILGVGLFLPGRWYAFLYVLLAMIGVLGLRHLVYTLNTRAVMVGVTVFVLVVPGMMLISGAATQDNPVFDDTQLRYAFTEREMSAVHTLDATTTADTAPLYTDATYSAVFRRTDTALAAPLRIPENGHPTNELAIYREYQSTGAPLVTNVNRTPRVTQLEQSQVCPITRTRLYANGAVSVCRDAAE